MNNQPVVVEQAYDAPIAKVWQALTNVHDMRKWFFDVSDFKPEVGFEFSFSGSSDGIEYIHYCKVTEVVPGKKITYSWCYKDYPGDSSVTFELSEDKGKTKVQVKHEGLESFPANNKDFKKESFIGGWTHFLSKALPEYLAGIPA